jgi:hypothetical protein
MREKGGVGVEGRLALDATIDGDGNAITNEMVDIQIAGFQ